MKYYNINSKKAIEHLKSQSSEMKALIELIGEVETFVIEDPFSALIAHIIFQSISFKAALKIWERFYDNFSPISPLKVLNTPYDDLMGVGLSNSKTKYILNIAHVFHNREIRLDFNNMTDQEVMDELIKIKGVGQWTAQMFLIFCLERQNVISYGDKAIRKGLEWLYDIDHKITEEEFNTYRELFSPYNTVASHYLWEITMRAYMTDKTEK